MLEVQQESIQYDVVNMLLQQYFFSGVYFQMDAFCDAFLVEENQPLVVIPGKLTVENGMVKEQLVKVYVPNIETTNGGKNDARAEEFELMVGSSVATFQKQLSNKSSKYLKLLFKVEAHQREDEEMVRVRFTYKNTTITQDCSIQYEVKETVPTNDDEANSLFELDTFEFANF